MNGLWVFHLRGGARATWAQSSSPETVQIEPNLTCGATLQFESGSLGEVIRRCNKLHLQVFGATVFAHKLELDGIARPEWRAIHFSPNKAWLSHDAKTIWSQIAHAAWKTKVGRLWDCAARIAYQLETCIERLRQLSDQYANQLQTLLRRKEFPEDSRLNDLWTQSVFLSIQSFLTDACVLRDYLAEFAAAFAYHSPDAPRIRTHAALLKRIKSADLDDTLAQQLREISDTGGWLSELGGYRDLVVHSAPLALASRQLWVWCKSVRLPEGRRLPIVRFPLPPDPNAIMAARSKADFNNFEALVEQFGRAADVDPKMKDALRYTHGAVTNLAALAVELASYSPVAPEMPVITDADLAGPITWSTPAKGD